MDAFDAPVCLTRAAPLKAYNGQMIFSDVVDSDAISASGVLSCIAETGGEVVLPDSIRLPEFRTWLFARTADIAVLLGLPFKSICFVLKVADALDDARMDGWIDFAALRLTRYSGSHVQYERWQDSEPHRVADGLSMLSNALQHRLLVAATCSESQVENLLEFLPGHMHQAVVAATITSTKTLEAPLLKKSLPFVKALKAIPPAPPSVLSLNLHSPENSPLQSQEWQEAAPHLAQALQHHTGVTSLRLQLHCIDAASTKLLAPAIASLKSLQSLHMHSGVDASTSVTLKRMLQALPQLQTLSLSLMLASASRKRQRDAGTAGSPQFCLATMLSPATSLTSLRIHGHADGGKECFITAHPLALPHLSQLDLLFGRPVGCHSTDWTTNSHSIPASHVLSQLSAPLTSLDMHPERLGLDTLHADGSAHVLRLCIGLAHFTQLRRLCIKAPADEGVKQLVIQDAVTAAVPPALAELRQLERLYFAAEITTFMTTLPHLVSATGLSHLQLECHFSHRLDYSPVQIAELVSGLSMLPLLSLDLDLAVHVDQPGISSLLEHGLTQLTALRTWGWECLQTSEDIAALARMTDLQKLYLLFAPTDTQLHASCVRALQTLPALTSLAHTSEESDVDTLSIALISEAPPHAWPALQELRLELWDPWETDAVFRFVRSRPALTRLALDCRFSDFEQEQHHVDVRRRIEREAAEAKIALSFEYEFFF